MPRGVYARTEDWRRIRSEVQTRLWQDHKYAKSQTEALLGTNPEYPNGGATYWRILSRKTWENYHGRTIPEWAVCHHWDWDITNIDPQNLGLLNYSHHQQIHKRDIKGKSLREIIPLLIENNILGEQNGRRSCNLHSSHRLHTIRRI